MSKKTNGWVKIFVRDALDKDGKTYKLCTINIKEHITLEKAYAAAQTYLEDVVDGADKVDYFISRMELSDGHIHNYDRKDRETYKNEYCEWAEAQIA